MPSQTPVAGRQLCYDMDPIINLITFVFVQLITENRVCIILFIRVNGFNFTELKCFKCYASVLNVIRCYFSKIVVCIGGTGATEPAQFSREIPNRLSKSEVGWSVFIFRESDFNFPN